MAYEYTSCFSIPKVNIIGPFYAGLHSVDEFIHRPDKSQGNSHVQVKLFVGIKVCWIDDDTECQVLAGLAFPMAAVRSFPISLFAGHNQGTMFRIAVAYQPGRIIIG